MTACDRHPPGCCCPECPGHAYTDGHGFPHPSEAKGRRPLRRCPLCHHLVTREDWISDVRRPFFGCRECSTATLPGRA